MLTKEVTVSKKPIAVCQFWNTSTPPDEVAALIATWQKDPNYTHRLYTAQTADDFIATHFDARTLAAYRSCAVPAMQADFFRYCILLKEGGIYVDADVQNNKRLYDFINDEDQGLLMTRIDRVANDILFVREAGNALIARTLEKAIENIEARQSNNVWLVTGPGIMTQFYKREDMEPLFAPFRMEQIGVMRQIIGFKNDLAYKSSEDDWRHNLKEGAPSIFR